MSLFVTCRTEQDIDRVAGALSDGGEFLMPLDNYGFGRKFAWVKDKYGVSWQLKFA
jgi:predicted 3-demethylubiquinone-9 3-methyltransferase (glyoxalase superfamily)